MGLAKEGYRDAQQLTTKVKVGINEDGYIATGGEQVVGSRQISITRANAANGLTDNNKLFNFFIGMLGGQINATSNKASVTWNV